MVHHTVAPVDRPHHRNTRTVLALICSIALLGGCGGSSEQQQSESERAAQQRPAHFPAPSVGSVRSANCTDWKRGRVDQRQSTVVQLRKFAGGPVGSSAGIKTGPVLDDERAYKILQSYCRRYFARGFKLYKLYERAAAYIGH